MKKIKDTNLILNHILTELNEMNKELSSLKESIKLLELKFDIHEQLNNIKKNDTK